MSEVLISCCPRCAPGSPWPSGLLGDPFPAFRCSNCGCHGRNLPEFLSIAEFIDQHLSDCFAPQPLGATIVDENPTTTPTAGG